MEQNLEVVEKERVIPVEVDDPVIKIGITKGNHSSNKRARLVAKASRKVNRLKKRHHKTAKEKKARKNGR